VIAKGARGVLKRGETVQRDESAEYKLAGETMSAYAYLNGAP
jgi:hypothetical protein